MDVDDRRWADLRWGDDQANIGGAFRSTSARPGHNILYHRHHHHRSSRVSTPPNTASLLATYCAINTVQHSYDMIQEYSNSCKGQQPSVNSLIPLWTTSSTLTRQVKQTPDEFAAHLSFLRRLCCMRNQFRVSGDFFLFVDRSLDRRRC